MSEISKITLPNGKEYDLKDTTARNAANSAVPNTRTVNGKALSSNISLGAGDVGAYTKKEIDTKISAAIASAYKYKGSVTADKLPTSGQVVGDVYNITNDSSYGKAGMNVAWTGTTWDALGSNVDLSNYVTTSDSRLSNARPASDVYAWAKAASKPSYSASEIGGLGNLATKNSLSAGDVGAVSKSGDTMTGNLTAPSFQTGTGDANYFQCKKFRGEGNANTYYHAIDFGYADHNKVDFHEYGGEWNFLKNTAGKSNTGVAVGSIKDGKGWVGKVNGYDIGMDVPAGSKLTDTVYDDTAVREMIAGKQDTLTFDDTPTADSSNPVTSGGVKAYVDANAGGGSSGSVFGEAVPFSTFSWPAENMLASGTITTDSALGNGFYDTGLLVSDIQKYRIFAVTMQETQSTVLPYMLIGMFQSTTNYKFETYGSKDFTSRNKTYICEWITDSRSNLMTFHCDKYAGNDFCYRSPSTNISMNLDISMGLRNYTPSPSDHFCIYLVQDDSPNIVYRVTGLIKY